MVTQGKVISPDLSVPVGGLANIVKVSASASGSARLRGYRRTIDQAFHRPALSPRTSGIPDRHVRSP
jgi:hypothetical protein